MNRQIQQKKLKSFDHNINWKWTLSNIFINTIFKQKMKKLYENTVLKLTTDKWENDRHFWKLYIWTEIVCRNVETEILLKEIYIQFDKKHLIPQGFHQNCLFNCDLQQTIILFIIWLYFSKRKKKTEDWTDKKTTTVFFWEKGKTSLKMFLFLQKMEHSFENRREELFIVIEKKRVDELRVVNSFKNKYK